MPVVASRDVFRFVVAALQGVGFSELGDSLIVPSENAQVVAVHMLGVRNGGAESGVNLTVFHGFPRVSDRLKSMHEIMLSGKIVRRDCQSRLIVGNGTHQPTLSTTCGRGLFGVSAQQPKLAVIRIFRQRRVNCCLIGLVLTAVEDVVYGLQLL